jgi:reactive intermediate/imine deaminase
MTEKSAVNPWTWQDRRGFTQAWRIDNPTALVFVSGQAPVDPDGTLVGVGDFEAQARQTFDNLARVLETSGATFADVVKVTVYLTDIATLAEYTRIKAGYIQGQQPASTAIAVPALAHPDMMIEVEAVAVH